MGKFEIKDGVLEKYHGKDESVVIPDSVVEIGDSAFESCQTIRSVEISKSVECIDDYAFYNCDNLKTIKISSSVKIIENTAFLCDNLEFIDVDVNNKYFKSVDGVLFNIDLSSLIKYPANIKNAKYIIPNSVRIICANSFYGCKNLQNIEIPNSVKTICDSAFAECDNLKLLNIPEGCIDIGEYAFEGCCNIEEINISSTVQKIAHNAFREFKKLKSINVDKNNKCFSSVSGILFDKNMTKIIKYPPNIKSEYYEIPNGILNIADEAFDYCCNLKEVIIPNSVKHIGLFAFGFCDNLQSITLPKGLDSLNTMSFVACNNLKEIQIPNSMQHIYQNVVCDCFNLKNIYYEGSKVEWGNIQICSKNECLNNATVHFNYNSKKS